MATDAVRIIKLGKPAQNGHFLALLKVVKIEFAPILHLLKIVT